MGISRIFWVVWFISVWQAEPSSGSDGASANVNGSEPTVRRKRLKDDDQSQWIWEGREAAIRVLTAAESTLDSVADSLEELWDRESARAASEVERLLQGAIGSMPRPSPVAMAPVTMMPIRPPPVTPSPSSSNPDCLQGRTPEQFLLDEIAQVTNVNLLLDPNTPQGMAFNFMLEDSTNRTDLCGYSTLEQRYGLGKCPRRILIDVIYFVSLTLSNLDCQS